MCRAFTSTSPPAAIGRLLPLVALVQAAAEVAGHWRQVEELREARLRKEQELQRDQARLDAQLVAFQQLLLAQVAIEEARSRAFAAAMATITPMSDPAFIPRILDMARDLLDRAVAPPVMNADWGR